MSIRIENLLYKLRMFWRNRTRVIDLTGIRIAWSLFFKMLPPQYTIPLGLQTNNFAKKKRNRIIKIILTIVFLLCLTYILVFEVKPRIEQRYYGIGFFDGQMSVVGTINSAVEIPIIFNEDDQIDVRWVSLNEVCERLWYLNI